MCLLEKSVLVIIEEFSSFLADEFSFPSGKNFGALFVAIKFVSRWKLLEFGCDLNFLLKYRRILIEVHVKRNSIWNAIGVLFKLKFYWKPCGSLENDFEIKKTILSEKK